jgi:hypothetical protein
MNIGTLVVTFGSSSSQDYYTPWFPKGADNAHFTYEIIRQNFGTGGTPSPGFSVEVFTKNREDVGSQGTTVSGSWTNFTGTSFYDFEATNLRELVRFKITVKGGTTPPTGQEGVVYRILPPTWYDKAV